MFTADINHRRSLIVNGSLALSRPWSLNQVPPFLSSNTVALYINTTYMCHHVFTHRHFTRIVYHDSYRGTQYANGICSERFVGNIGTTDRRYSVTDIGDVTRSLA